MTEEPPHRPILIACPNLSLDRTIAVDALKRGHVHRSTASDARGGGKGVNVARALKALGLSAEVVVISAGRTGEAVMAMLGDEGLQAESVWGSGETRACLTVLCDRSITVFNESGPCVAPQVWTAFEAEVARRLESTTILAVSGSFPPGSPDDGAARLVRAAHEVGAFTICDTSRAQLAGALGAGPRVITPNLAEAEGVLHGDTAESVDISGDALQRGRRAAEQLLDEGPGAVVVTLGAAGAILATHDGTHELPGPEVVVRNPVGAGDCLVAGLAAGEIAGRGVAESTRRGCAMAAASCETFAAGVLDPSRYLELLEASPAARAEI